jgi:hypothetical protein
MRIDRAKTNIVSVAAGVVLFGAGIAGCKHSDDGAAPYGTSASPSAAPTQASVTTVPDNPPSPDAIAPTTPPSAPPAAPSGAQGADVTAPPIGTTGGGPMTPMGGNSPTAPLTPTPDLDAKIASAEKSGSKTGLGAAYAERGTFRMNDPNAGARVKYRAALDDYRKSLAADPANAEAKHNKDLIESIYKQMGRPIPGAS